MRLLPVIRLSLVTENTTSPERQMEKIQYYALGNDHELVPVTDADYDLDVSGAVSPFDRPGLGRWLQDDRLDMWDALCVAKLDRISRSLFDFTALLHWLEAHGKSLVVLDPMMDLSTPAGRAMANMLMSFAEYEREVIGQRVADAHRKLVTSGKYTGGMVPFGYMPVKLAKNWGYEPDPEYAPLVAEMAERFLRGETLGGIARWLRESGVPSPKNVIRKRNGKPLTDTPWSPSVVRMILKSPTVLGMATDANREIVRDNDGVAVYRSEPLITRDQYERIQARLALNPAPVRVNTSPLLQVAFCLCGASMHSTTTNRKSYPSDRKGEPVTYAYRYYHCHSSHLRDGKCSAKRIKAEALEGAVHDALLEFAGDVELTEEKVIPGRDYSEDIARVAEQIGHLNKEIAIGTATRKDVSGAREALDRANGELARLASLEPEKARIEPVKLGKTFRQHWETLDVAGRNEFIRSAGVYAAASRDVRPPAKFIAQLAMRGSIATVFNDDVNVVIYLGNLGKLRSQARSA
jgi:site-specific DNA recombinase